MKLFTQQLHKKSTGFTLTEMLAVVALVAILVAAAFVGVGRLRRNLRQRELDSKAEIIYMAAQSRITQLRTGGFGDLYGAPRGRRNCVDMGYCTREQLRVPRGERYELCRSVHAEANAIISASRRDMVGGTLYLVGRNAQTGELLPDATSCPMCRRHIINAGLERVVIRHTPTEFQVVDVQDWIDSEDDVPQA